jgi:hypothetical protein
MIQRHQLLINPNFSAQTASVNSSLTTVGGYQVNNVQGLGGGIVNPSNVRGFLNNDVNEFIINDFFSYLTGSTTTDEFAEIYHSDQKLSDVFNNYYVSSVLNNQFPPTSVIDNSLTGTSGTTIIENSVYEYNGVAPSKGLTGIPLSIDGGDRSLKIYSSLITYTTEESYYIPVFIKRTSKQASRLNFKDEEQITILFDDVIFVEDLTAGNGYDYGTAGSTNPDIAQDTNFTADLSGPSVFDQFL